MKYYFSLFLFIALLAGSPVFAEEKTSPEPNFKAFLFLKQNITAGGMPLSYKTPKGYWGSFVSSEDKVAAVIERLLVEHGLSIYDAALWQITLTAVSHGKDQRLVDDYTNRLLSGSSGELDNIRAYGPIFKYGEKKAVMQKENAYFFRMIADQYMQEDPLGEVSVDGFPGFSMPHHEDWKPITGEQAWAAIIGPLQVAYSKYGQKIPFESNEVRLALSVLPAFEAMQSGLGALYHAPEGTYGKDPEEISNENNFSVYMALKMLSAVVKDRDPKADLRLQEILRRQDKYFREFAFNRAETVFYQGGFYKDKKFIPTQIFAVDCQTGAFNSLGPAWIDDAFGEGVSYQIWQNMLDRAGYFSEKGDLQGLGFSDGHRILSVEWTCGAILSARLLADFYRASHPDWAGKIEKDAADMRAGIEKFKMSLPDGSEAYLYANERYFIPFGWWANPVPSLASTAWVILTDLKFNPFVLGGAD